MTITAGLFLSGILLGICMGAAIMSLIWVWHDRIDEQRDEYLWEEGPEDPEESEEQEIF